MLVALREISRQEEVEVPSSEERNLSEPTNITETAGEVEVAPSGAESETEEDDEIVLVGRPQES